MNLFIEYLPHICIAIGIAGTIWASRDRFAKKAPTAAPSEGVTVVCYNRADRRLGTLEYGKNAVDHENDWFLTEAAFIYHATARVEVTKW